MFEDKYANSGSILWLWRKISRLFVRKDGNKVLSDNNYTDADKAKLGSVEQGANNYTLPIASSENLGGIRIGSGLEIDSHGIVTTVVNPEVTMRWTQITNTPSTLAGYGITDGATKTELQQVAQQISHAYKYKGSVSTYDDLEDIVDPEIGDVYNIEDTGKNFAWTGTEWDDLGGLADLSDYWSKEELQALTAQEVDVITGVASTTASFMDILDNSSEVLLDSNLAFSSTVTIDKSFTIDLGEQTISSTMNQTLFDVDGGTLTIKGNGTINVTDCIATATNGGRIVINGGSYVTNDVGFTCSGNGTKVTFNRGSLEAGLGGIGAADGGEILINGGEIEVDDNYAIYTNPESGRGNNIITINGGTITGNSDTTGYEACGVYIANNDTFTMTGGSIVGEGGCGILMRGGTVTISNGSVTATTGTNVPGRVGTNSTNMSASAVIYHETANFPGKDGMSLTISGGNFVGANHSVEVLSNEVTPDVTVTGGSFNPAYPEA